MANTIDRSTNIRDITHKPGEGVRFCESPMATQGAKDGLSGNNTTETFSTSAKISGPFGGMNKGK